MFNLTTGLITSSLVVLPHVTYFLMEKRCHFVISAILAA